MISRVSLTHHPFGVEALLSRTTVLTYAAPAAELRCLLPECLTLDTLDDQWGFVAVALVQTRQLRPQGLPAWLGQDFFLIGYRVFVRYTTAAGKRLRGLYILQSATDKRRMQWLGNLFTGYHYRTIDIRHAATETSLEFHSERAGLHIAVATVAAAAGEPGLPAGSPFGSWQQARRFAGPLPFTFSYQPARREVVIVEGEREQWRPRPVRVQAAVVPFIESLGLSDVRLASAFTMTDIPYRWKKGRTERWQP
ncbi:DUF2071 domain-containing protein [Hymenobacter rubripertinctus]|uniref:DUF2071 domain-containing protein n=1 Tax=Hymenobacter rubripertinctus TaxID=2029981 RepID=A0A418QVR7_9BACT|nr:DUF2071 domain-containing protein [Hymenobacter rubripertinctus]RIY09234.1 hypothetical protein D0T11_12400 [Hymenobacter rubripertinctus]